MASAKPKAPAKKTTTKKKSTGRTITTSGAVAFTTPSGNRSTQRPADCDEAWGNVFYLYNRAGFLCSDSTLSGAAPASSAWFAQTDLEPLKSFYGPQAVLPYGWTLRNRTYSCTSATTGVTCTDLDTGRGLLISKSKYRFL